jgi:hypothetical protein
MMMMMEIIMNPMSVPKSAAHLGFVVSRNDVSAMNRAVATESIATSSIFARNVGDLR